MRMAVRDEMQIQRKNKAGNQSFLLLYYLLLADMGLGELGWGGLHAPMSVFIIMNAVMAFYLLRTIFAGAFAPPASGASAVKRRYGLAGLAAVLLIVSGTLWFAGGIPQDSIWRTVFGIVLLASAILLLISLSASWIIRAQSHSD